jgi:hypothetical protein
MCKKRYGQRHVDYQSPQVLQTTRTIEAPSQHNPLSKEETEESSRTSETTSENTPDCSIQRDCYRNGKLHRYQTLQQATPETTREAEKNFTTGQVHRRRRRGRRLSRRIAQRLQHRELQRQANLPILQPPNVLYECSTEDPTANTELRARQSAADTCTRNFGFVANPALSKFANLNNIMSANLRCRSFDRAPIHRKVHNLFHNPTDVSPDVLEALGLGLGFGLSLKRKDKNPINFDRLSKDLRTRYFFRNTPPRKLNFPKLYVKSPDWVPDNAHKKSNLP